MSVDASAEGQLAGWAHTASGNPPLCLAGHVSRSPRPSSACSKTAAEYAGSLQLAARDRAEMVAELEQVLG